MLQEPFIFLLRTKKQRCSFRRNMEIKVPGSMAELYPSLAGKMMCT